MKKIIIAILLVLLTADIAYTQTVGGWSSGSGVSAYTDVTALFGSGSCSGLLYSDGTCKAIGTDVQAYYAILSSIGGVGAGAANQLLGYNNSGTLGWYSNHSHDDSAAQFYSATASKGTMKFVLSGSTADKLMTITSSHTEDRTVTLPDATGTLVYSGGPILSGEVLIDCNGSADPYAYCTSANASTLTATHTSRTIINSYGRGEEQTVTLPAAATGMTFIAIVGTQHNSDWKIQRAGSDTITWSSGGTDTTGKTYFQETNQAVGSRVSCITYKSGASAWTWLCGSVTGTWVTD